MALNRQQWLAKFLELVDTDAPAMNYRKMLGIGFNVLPNHLKKIGEYRDELTKFNSTAVVVNTDIQLKTEVVRGKNVDVAKEAKEAKSKESNSGSKTLGPRTNPSKE